MLFLRLKYAGTALRARDKSGNGRRNSHCLPGGHWNGWPATPIRRLMLLEEGAAWGAPKKIPLPPHNRRHPVITQAGENTDGIGRAAEVGIDGTGLPEGIAVGEKSRLYAVEVVVVIAADVEERVDDGVAFREFVIGAEHKAGGFGEAVV